MIIVKRCIRAYYEKNGNFDGIEKMSFYGKIEEQAKNVNMDVENYMYDILGYKNDLDLTSVQRHSYRRSFVKDEYAKLYKIFRVKNKSSLANALENLDCLGLKAKKPKAVEHDAYVKLLADYFKYDKTHLFNNSERLLTFGDIIFGLSLLTNVQEVNSNLGSETFKKALKSVTPKIKVAENAEPLIQLQTMYIPEQLSIKERNKIVNEAVFEAAFNASKISFEDRLNVIELIGKGLVDMAEKTPQNYLNIIDTANSLDLTVEQLILYCGLQYIDILEQVRNMNCTVELVNKGSVRVYSMRSKNKQESIICNLEDFKYLYENDLLKSLTFDNGIGYVTTDNKVPVSLLFIDSITNNFVR